jgi:NAD+ synthase
MNRIIDYENLSIKIQDWIKSYVNENGISTLVVGVSGGIDSAVVSTLCAETGIPTIVVGMPINSSPENTKLSDLQISLLSAKYDNVEGYYIDLSPVFESFKSHKAFDKRFNSELGFANTKSRLRMVSLYQIAASSGGIVIGTGNKVEDFGVGFYTKYGDGGVDISPIADLYKSEVRELGKLLGVPQEIINAEPTDGLWEDNRVDETQIGSTYDELEWAMEYGMNKWSEQLELTEKEKTILTTYANFNTKNKHKMVSIPIFDLKENNIV